MTKTQAHKTRMAELRGRALQIVAGGKCPDCGAGLHRNSALAGWYQCDRLGADGFRKDPTGPACSFQCFTE